MDDAERQCVVMVDELYKCTMFRRLLMVKISTCLLWHATTPSPCLHAWNIQSAGLLLISPINLEYLELD